MKLCVNCKHYHLLFKGVFSGSEHTCSQENIIDVVDGEKLYRKCSKMRDSEHDCGPDGKLFEVK